MRYRDPGRQSLDSRLRLHAWRTLRHERVRERSPSGYDGKLLATGAGNHFRGAHTRPPGWRRRVPAAAARQTDLASLAARRRDPCRNSRLAAGTLEVTE